MFKLMINTDLDNADLDNNKNLLITTSPKRYIEHHYYKDIKNISIPNKKKRKVNADTFYILGNDEYNDVLKYNYNVSQLKTMCKHYGYKVNGNKSELLKRLYNSMRLSYYAVKIQGRFRMMMTKILFKMKKLHLLKNAINDIDFLTLEPISQLKMEQLICIESGEKHVYSFDICSLYNLFKEQFEYAKQHRKNIQQHMATILNPFNRQPFPPCVHKRVFNIIKYSKICKLKVKIDLNNEEYELCLKKDNMFKAIELFQTIDTFGFITDSKWLMDLRGSKLVKFLNELIDIWNYRAQLSAETKNKIFPPSLGNPFRPDRHLYTRDIEHIKSSILKLVSKFISAGVDRHSQSLAVFYVLGALTMVSSPAANNLPWLYESFSNLQLQ